MYCNRYGGNSEGDFSLLYQDERSEILSPYEHFVPTRLIAFNLLVLFAMLLP